MAATNKALRAKLERLRLEDELRLQEQSQGFIGDLPRLAESLGVGTQIVDRTEFLRDDGFFGEVSTSATRPSDHEHGDNYPHWRTEIELAEIRGICRFLANSCETAIAIRDARRNHVIGQGFEITCQPQKALKTDPFANEVSARITAWIERQLEHNRWAGEYEFEAYNALLEDGELLWLIEEDEYTRGVIRFRYEQPDFLTQPSNDRMATEVVSGPDSTLLDWKYGIGSPRTRSDVALGYFVLPYGEQQGSVYRPHQVEHIRTNVRRYVKRGVSDFYPVWRKLHNLEKLLGNTVQGAAVQAAIAYIREHTQGQTPEQVKNYVVSRRDGTMSTPTGSGGNRQTNFRKATAGTVVDVVAGAKYHAGPMGASQSPIYIQVIQQALRIVGTRWHMPEYMISSDASNGNYASSLVAESPFVKSCESSQYGLCQSYQRLFSKMVRMGCELGFIEYPWHVVTRNCVVNVQGPDVSTRDEEKAHAMRKSQHALGYLSLETMATQEGLDVAEEQAKGAKPQEQAQQQQQQTQPQPRPAYEAWLGYP